MSAVVAATSLGCDLFGPSKSVAGNWHFTFGKWYTYEMTLTQSGDRISGTVCAYALTYPAGPVRQATVSGDYPVIRFTDPMIAACEHEARFEEERDQIAGDCDERGLVRFTRGGGGRCAGAAPPR